MKYEFSKDFAQKADQADALRAYREQFFIPQHEGRDCIYLTGNSLGLQPKGAEQALKQELDDWAKMGVEGHFHAQNPWFHYHEFFAEDTANLVGALPHEVVVMNNLTVNLHLMFVSFYRPREGRYKILMEAGAFPSDMYAVESQVKFHGYDYDDAVIEMRPRSGEYHLRTEDILDTINEYKDELALVFFSGLQYYSGQAFDMEQIAAEARAKNITVGFDLAHAAGNLQLKLHDWGVDFACWCSYKYLNSGPGSVSGCYVHEKHADNPSLPRFAGWWGRKEEGRFEMTRGFIPEYGAAGWQLSNAPVLSMAVHRLSLQMFTEVGMPQLRKKGDQLTSYLEFVLKEVAARKSDLDFNIITPPLPHRGSQLSVLTGPNGKALFDFLTKEGVIADWREPNVIRMAPVPLYNSFEDIYRLGEIMMRAV
jgi:kynureninase